MEKNYSIYWEQRSSTNPRFHSNNRQVRWGAMLTTSFHRSRWYISHTKCTRRDVQLYLFQWFIRQESMDFMPRNLIPRCNFFHDILMKTWTIHQWKDNHQLSQKSSKKGAQETLETEWQQKSNIFWLLAWSNKAIPPLLRPAQMDGKVEKQKTSRKQTVFFQA